MKVCIPTLDDRGVEGKPSDHFGSAPFFTFVDTDTGKVETQRNGGENHVHGSCRPLESLGAQSVDAILCRGLGKRAYSRLEAGGIGVFVTLEKDVEGTLKAFAEGRLQQLTSEEACHGHSHSHAGSQDRSGMVGRSGGRGCGHDYNQGRERGRDRLRGFETWGEG
ncbi:MAG: NifB/NifX family molybdenum-iron cluster-binding protein [Gemmatimonadetes bacterium]|nr:NifB/NifX family molybdenum-iron cluster-binding protein [Gemmatimonadota bacterium]NNM04768.1 NifB/NifX family molybdenum-iron cluster-binding protein [Gemmatimonadota bacterium]